MAQSPVKNKFARVIFYEATDKSGTTYEPVGITQILTPGAALNVWANVPNPASQLIEAPSKESLEALCKNNIENMKDPEWVEHYITPFI